MSVVPRILLAITVFMSACSSQERPGHTFSPRLRSFSQSALQQLKVPQGFVVDLWARDLGHPRMLAIGPDGTVYVTRDDEGDVLALKDTGGKVSKPKPVASLSRVHGIAIKGNTVWLATADDLYSAELQSDGAITTPKKMPVSFHGGGHDRRTLGIGPDGMLYASIGSTCNICADPPDENAVIWRMKTDGSHREVFARGLRNTIGFEWQPETKEMWGMDHGVDWLGDDYPREELNKIEAGKNYGWPYCTNEKKPDARIRPQGGKSGEQYCAATVAPVLTYTAHAAPIAMVFYNGALFPQDYRGDAFVAMHGSWNRKPASGYEVVRIKFHNGKPVRIEPFLQGFLLNDGTSQFGRPAGLAVMKDGSLLISDDDNGVIYRVTYKK